MVAGKSPEWLPPGFTEKVKIKNGRKIKYYYNVATGVKYHSKKDVIRCAKAEDFFHDTPQKTKDDDSGPSFNKIDAILVKTNKSPEWLPHGWIMEERMRKNGSREGSAYKVYIDPSTGNRFYSRVAVARYLKTVDQNDGTTEQIKLDNVGERFLNPDTSLQCKSLTEAGCIAGKKLKRKKSFTVVATVSTSADGLPPGWIKEIKTSKSGNKIRKDPYYIDPVSGYTFLSKKDALRYLETSDIGSCANIPKRKEIEDLKLNNNEIPLDNVGDPFLKPDTLLQCESVTDADCVPEKKRTSKNSFSMVATESTSADGLPPGWIKEIKTSKSGNKIRKDAYYTDPVGGYVFRSKNDVLRYLETNDIGSCACKPKRRDLDDLKLIKNKMPLDNVGKPLLKPDISLQGKPMTDEGCIPETKKKSKNSSTTVATEITSADGLPPGWIKEIKTSKSGNKIRKDPYYTDSISGYIFYSKKDVLRYLETNDISSCATTPKRRELDDLKLIENKIHLDNMGETFLKPDTPLQLKSMTNEGCIPETKKKSKRSFTTVGTERTSVDGLPPGWIKEIKTSKFGNKIRKDPYYTDPICGYIFRSKKDVLRYLETNDIGSCAITPKKRELDDLKLIENKIPLDNVGEPLLKTGVPIQCKSMTDAASVTETKKKSQYSSTTVCAVVATESTSADGLPPGWIKEIKTTKSGNNIRKDPYYTDPVSGYIFRSKKDVWRFLETNDISSCAITPKRRGLYDLNSSSPIDEKLSEHLETKRKLFVGRESNGVGESSSTKNLPALEAEILKVTSAGADSLKDKNTGENSNKLADMKHGPERTNECSEQGVKAMAEVLAICSFINESFDEEKLPESGMRKRTDGTQVGSRKSKKIRDLNLPSRASKRLSRCEPEMLSDVDLSDRTLRSAAKRSSAASIPPQPSDLDQANDIADHAFIGEETLLENKPLNKVEKPLTEDKAISIEQKGGQAIEKKLDDDCTMSQESQLGYAFSDSWSDPCLEFAFKTLTGEIPIEDTLTFPGVPYNQEDGFLGPSESNVPIIFQSDIPPGFESSVQTKTADKLPTNPSLSPPTSINFTSCSGGGGNVSQQSNQGQEQVFPDKSS